MYDDELELDQFSAIVSELDDPEWLRWRRLLLGAGAAAFVVGLLMIAVLAGMGWLGVVAFASTFLPGLALVTHIQHARFARPPQTRS